MQPISALHFLGPNYLRMGMLSLYKFDLGPILEKFNTHNSTEFDFGVWPSNSSGEI